MRQNISQNQNYLAYENLRTTRSFFLEGGRGDSNLKSKIVLNLGSSEILWSQHKEFQFMYRPFGTLNHAVWRKYLSVRWYILWPLVF